MSEQIQCRTCGGQLVKGTNACDYCGAPINDPDLSEEELAEFALMLRGWNSLFHGFKKQKETWEAAAFFGVVAIALGLGLLARLYFELNWLLTIVIAVAGFAGALAIGFAIEGSILKRLQDNIYENTIKPQLDAYVVDHQVTRWQVQRLAQTEKQIGQPLRRYLLVYQ